MLRAYRSWHGVSLNHWIEKPAALLEEHGKANNTTLELELLTDVCVALWTYFSPTE